MSFASAVGVSRYVASGRKAAQPTMVRGAPRLAWERAAILHNTIITTTAGKWYNGYYVKIALEGRARPTLTAVGRRGGVRGRGEG